MEDLENRGQRSNLRLGAFPKSGEQEDLRTIVTDIFRNLLGAPEDKAITLDRVHRTLGPR